MTPDFIGALTQTMMNEGYLILEDVPGDSGGETFSGISRVNNPTWPGWTRVDAAKLLPDVAAALKDDKVLEVLVGNFYRTNYWDKNRCQDMVDQCIAFEVFDMGVNLGTGQEAKYFQRALNCSYAPGKYFAPLTVDGIIGDVTIQSLTTLLLHEVAQEFANALNAFAAMHYIQLAEVGKQKFFRGWLRRVEVLPITR